MEDDYYSFKKLVIFGCAESGKTSLRKALDGSYFEPSYQPSEKTIIPTKLSCNVKGTIKKTLALNVVEVRLTKEKTNEDIVHNLLFESQCALFVVNLNAADSFAPIQSLIQSKLNRWRSSFPFLKLIIVGNKKDLDRKVSAQEIKELTDLAPDLIQSTDISLMKQDGVDALIESIYKAQTNVQNKVPLNIVSMSNNMVNKNITTGFRLVLLGDSGVGKTNFMNRHFKNEFSEAFLSTIGIDDATEAIKIRNEQMKLQIWDTAGQERFRCLPRKYYQNADGILLLFSFDSRESFENVSKWMNDITQNSNKVIGSGEDANSLTLFLLGNKCDVDERVVTRQEAEKKAQECGMEYYEISCKLNINIDEVIANIILRCYSKSTGVKDCFSLTDKPKNVGKKKCCG